MFIWPFGKRRTASKPLVDLQHMDAPLSREVASILAGAGVPTFRQALPGLTAELERARRYDRPLAIALVTDARVAPDPRSGAADPRAGGPLAPGSPLLPGLVASVLRELVRETDTVTFAAALGRCLVMMPEVTGEEARRALHRIGELCAARLAFAIRVGTAAFPENGWTLEDLIQYAEAEGFDRAEGSPVAALGVRVGESAAI
jgi:hypothetical protein